MNIKTGFIISIVCFVFSALFFGIEFDREWMDPAPFVKYRPTLKFAFHDPLSEMDTDYTRHSESDIAERETYQIFCRDKRVNEYFLLPLLVMLSLSLNSAFVLSYFILKKHLFNRRSLRRTILFVITSVPLSILAFAISHWTAAALFYRINGGFHINVYVIAFVCLIILMELVRLFGLRRYYL